MKLITCGVSPALSVKLRVALRVPVAEGVNVTLTAQEALGASVAPVQVSSPLAKSLAFVPPKARLEMVRFTWPVLVIVSAWATLVVLRTWLPKLMLEAERLATGSSPDPLKPTVCGLLRALSEKIRDPVRAPKPDGVNVMLSEQVALGVRVAPAQESALLAKSPGFAPITVTVAIVRSAVPPLVTVSVITLLAILNV